jgi:hypothetical protein
MACAEHRIGAPANFDPKIAGFRPSQFRERTPEGRERRPPNRIVLHAAHQRADQPHRIGLLRARRKRACGRAAKKCDELAPLQLINLHSINLRSGAAHRRIS